MANMILRDHIKELNRSERLKVAIGLARGFAWLHHTCNPGILHCNISSKCILLYQNFEPKISDFGLARLMNPTDTHLRTFANGEFGGFGYVAPEYTHIETTKSDVYSFGVVLLELVTGESPNQVSRETEGFNGNIIEWVKHLSENNVLSRAIDKDMIENSHDFEDAVMQFLKVACSCILFAPKERPTMFEVYQLLSGIGQKYHFSCTVGDDVSSTDNTEEDELKDLIVA